MTMQRFSQSIVTEKIHDLFKKYKTLTSLDIIHVFGFSKTTTYQILNDFEAQEIITPVGKVNTTCRGHKPRIWVLNSFYKKYLKSKLEVTA